MHLDWIDVPIRVRYGETDQMGHAYYANYLFWFEVARGEWCRSRGFTYKSLEAEGLFLPVVEVWVRYRGEIHYDDDITVRIRLAELKRSSMKFEYEIFKGGERVTEGYTWHVLMGPERKAVAVPESLKSKLAGSGIANQGLAADSPAT
jgi:acyl-CoA thioester hydrolase